jgi:chromosome segregation ATPase
MSDPTKDKAPVGIPILDPIKDAIRKSNEANRVRVRKAAELAAAPIVAELNVRIAELESEKATLAETCKAVQDSNEALRSANVGLTDRVNELGKENTAFGVRIAELESEKAGNPDGSGNPGEPEKAKGRKKAQ